MSNILRSIKQTFLFAVLVTASTSSLLAIDPPDFRIINAGLGKQFALSIEGLAQTASEFQVRSAGGDLIMAELFNGPSYRRLFSLEELQEGDYIFVLKTEETEIVQPVELTKRAILYTLDTREITFVEKLARE